MSCERLADPNIELYPLEYPLKGGGGGWGYPLERENWEPCEKKKACRHNGLAQSKDSTPWFQNSFTVNMEQGRFCSVCSWVIPHVSFRKSASWSSISICSLIVNSTLWCPKLIDLPTLSGNPAVCASLMTTHIWLFKWLQCWQSVIVMVVGEVD